MNLFRISRPWVWFLILSYGMRYTRMELVELVTSRQLLSSKRTVYLWAIRVYPDGFISMVVTVLVSSLYE